MTTVLATYSIKGGVGKTSAAVSLAQLAAAGGEPTLVWDLDPQGAATYLFRVRPKVPGGAKRLARGGGDPAAAIRATDLRGLDLLPADFRLRHLDLALDREKHPLRRLRAVIDAVAGGYRWIVLDCAPSISLVSEGVFRAADALLVPVVPATLAARTLDQLTDVLAGEPRRPLVLPFFSMVDKRRSLHRETMERTRAAYPEMLGAAVPLADEVERMGSERRAIGELAPDSRGALAYRALWWDVRRRVTRR